jgi:hypothetical protein
LDLGYEERKGEWKEELKVKLDEQDELNRKAEGFLKLSDVYTKEEFQYPRMNLPIRAEDDSVKAIPRHDKKECIWVDTETSLKEMAKQIIKTSKAIGVDTEYHSIDKVSLY